MANTTSQHTMVLETQIKASGVDSAVNSYLKMTDALGSVASATKPAQTWLDKLGDTVANTFRYQIVNKFTDALFEGAQEITTYLRDVDKELNNIQIVSGKTDEQVKALLQTAQKGASALGNTTTNYLQAAEEYYQQGLSTNEVLERTNATLKAANISGQDVSTTVQQITAVLNGFNVSAKDVNSVLSVMSSLGAATATDFEELSTASQKVASAASTAGIPLNNTMAMITTIASVTRESAESVGTSLNSMLGRFNKLSVDEKQEVSSSIEETLKNTKSGVSMFDKTTGQVRNLNDVLTDLAGSWSKIDKNSQEAILTQLAGTRQANRLAALMNNWDDYEKNLKTASTAEGSLDAQNKVYMKSLESLDNQMKNASETMWGNLFNTDMLKAWDKGWISFYTTLGNIFKNIGGLQPIVGQIVTTVSPLVNKLASPLLYNVFNATNNTKMASNGSTTGAANQIVRSINSEDVGGVDLSKTKVLNRRQASNLSPQQFNDYNSSLDTLDKVYKLEQSINVLKTERKSIDDDLVESSRKQVAQSSEDVKIIQQKASAYSDVVKAQQEYDINAAKLKAVSPEFAALKSNGLSKSASATSSQPLTATAKKIFDEFSDDLGGQPKKIQDAFLALQKSLAKLKTSVDQTGDTFNIGDKELAEKKKNQYGKAAENAGSSDAYLQSISDKVEGVLGATKNSGSVIGEAGSVNKSAAMTGFFDKTKSFSSQTSNMDNLKEMTSDVTLFSAALKEAGVSGEQFYKIFNGSVQQGIENVNNKITESTGLLGSLKEKATIAAKTVNSALNSSKVTNVLQGITAVGGALITLSSTADTLSDSTKTGSAKTEAGIQGVGTALSALTSAIPGVGPIVSTLISTATTGLTYLAEKFQWGADEAEKAQDRLTNATTIMDAYTNRLDEEKNALSQVTGVADELGEKYKEQKFTYAELTEEEKTNYDQVAAYAETYAPELIQYYDEEGKAVLDLTKLYGDYGDTKRNALDVKYQQDAYEVYSSKDVQSNIGQNGADVLTVAQNASQKIIEDKQKLAQLQAQSLEDGGEDVSKKIQSVTEDLTAQQDAVKNLSSNWDDLVKKPMLYGNASYQNLSDSGQTLMNNLSSYSNFQEVGFSQDASSEEDGITEFSNKIQSFQNALAQAGDSANSFLGMDEQLQIAAANMGLSIGMTTDQFKDYISSMDQATFLQGSFLDGLTKIAESNAQKTIDNLGKSVTKTSKKEEKAAQDAKNVAKAKIYEGGGTASANGESGNSAKQYQDKQKETVQKNADAETNAVKRAEKAKQKATSRTYALWEKSIRKYAQSSNSAYNQVLDAYKENQKKMRTADADTKKSLKKSSQMQYAVLKGDDEDYYKKFLDKNKKQTLQAANQYGVRANKYKTYNEYMTALDTQQAKYKLIIENNAGKKISEITKQLTTEKYKNLAAQLQAAGDNASAMVMIEASESNDKVLLQNASTLNELLNLKDQLQGTDETSEEKYKSNVEMYNKISKAYNDATKGVDGATKLTEVGAENFGKESSLQLIDDAIAALQKNAPDAAAAAGINYDDLKKDLDDYSNALSDLTDTPDFNYDLGDVGDLSYKDVGDGSSPSYTTPSSGEGSKDKEPDEPKKTDVKSLDDLEEGEAYKEDIDKLKEYDDKITQLEHDITLLSDARAHLYGTSYLKNLDAEIKKQQESLEVSKQRLEATKKIAAEEKTDLDAQAKAHNISISYSSTGQLANYNEVIEAMEKASKDYQSKIDTKSAEVKALTTKYDALKAAYDTASDNDEDTAALNKRADQINALADVINKITGEVNAKVKEQTTYNDWASSFKDSMDSYEKYAVDEVQSTEEDIQDKITKVLEDKIDAIKYPVTIVVEAADENEKYLELLTSIAKNKGKVVFSVDSSANFDKLQNTLKEISALMQPSVKGGLDELIKQADNLLGKAADTDLASAPQDLLATIREEEESLTTTASNLQEIITNLSTAFSDGIDSAIDSLSKAYDKMSEITTAYDNLVNTAQKTNTDTFDLLTNAANINLETSKKQIEQLSKQAEAIKNTRDKFAEGTDEYLTADEAYIQQLNKIASLQQSAAEALSKTITNLTSRNNKDIESTLLGGTTLANLKDSLSEMNESRKKYLAQERAIYQLSKLEEDIQMDIDKKQDNSIAQKRLKDFQTSELEYLKSKKKLTQADFDLSEKQYALLKAQMELEDAQEGKNYVRMLQRNSSGNYAYMSVADTSKIDTAKEAYQKAIDELYQTASTGYDNALTNMSNATSTYEGKISKIISQYQAGEITKDKASDMYKQAQEALKATYEEEQANLELYAKQLAGSTELQDQASQSYQNMLKQNKTLDTLINGNAEGFDQLYKDMTGKDINDTVLKDLSNGVVDLTDNWKEFFDTIGTDISTVDFSKLDGNIETIMKSIDDYNTLLQQWGQTAANTADSIISSDLIDKINQNAENINEEATQQLDILTKTVTTYEAQKEAIENANASLLNMIKSLDAAAAKIEKTFGVTNGETNSVLDGTVSTPDYANSIASATSVDTTSLFAQAAKAAGATVTSSDQYHVEMEFPNVTDKDEIVSAFENLNNYVDQYLANNKN